MKEIKDYTYRIVIETLIGDDKYINQVVETKMTKEVGDAFLAQLHDDNNEDYSQSRAFTQKCETKSEQFDGHVTMCEDTNMKANELMIGDWVIADYKLEHQVYAKIGYLNPSHGDRHHDAIGFIPVPMIDNFEQYISDECSIHPIPLTDDILDTLGFAKYSYDESTGHWSNGDVNIDFDGEYYTTVLDMLFEIKYVHELQHALRLCGLNELADNFKLKEK